jgi:hypothetical protein
MTPNVPCNYLLTEVGIAVGATVSAGVVGTHVHRDSAQAGASLSRVLDEILVRAGQAPNEPGVDTTSGVNTKSAEVDLFGTGHHFETALDTDLADHSAQPIQVITVMTVNYVPQPDLSVLLDLSKATLDLAVEIQEADRESLSVPTDALCNAANALNVVVHGRLSAEDDRIISPYHSLGAEDRAQLNE